MVAHSALYKNERFASYTHTHTHTPTHRKNIKKSAELIQLTTQNRIVMMMGNVPPSAFRKHVLCLPNASIYKPPRTTERSPTLTETENGFIFIVYFKSGNIKACKR